MKEIQNVKSGKTARVSDRLAKALVGLGKFTYATRDMRPDPRPAPMVQPAVVAEQAVPAAEGAPEVEISPAIGKPKRQYRRRAAESTEEE